MKNDFDFIRDKIENSGVNAPADMDESYVMRKLEGVEPEAVPQLVEVKPKKPRYGLITGIAAAFVAVVTLSVLGVMLFSQQTRPAPAPGGVAKPSVSADIPLKTFNSYDEVKEYAAAIKKNASSYSLGKKYDAYIVEEDRAADAADNGSSGSSGNSSGGSSGGSGAGSGSHSETYRQVEGVDEADIVKTDGKYLYITDGNNFCIGVYSATDHPEMVTTIYPESFDRPTVMPYDSDDDDLDVFVQEMYLYNDRLIVCCMTRGEHFEYNTAVLVYDISDINNIKLIDRLNQSGRYNTSRMIGDRLYMLSEYDVYPDEFKAPVCCRGDGNAEIPVDCVYSVENPTDSDMLIVGGFGITDGSNEAQSSAILGSVEDVYCNENNLYIYTTKWHYDVIVDEERGSSAASKNDDPITTDIYKVSLTDGIAFTAFGTVEGYLDSRYSLDEKDGYLRVAATLEDEDYRDTNALYILDGSLKEVGRVSGFAKNESIKAVRYVGNTAYVITYEQTDPLFVIDLSNPTKPAILGEVKIDGFSTMLVPIDDNTVLGLGVYTADVEGISMQVRDGFKLALFDVSDKLHPKVLDEKAYPGCDSEVMSEPRALIYNPDRGDWLIPLNAYDVPVVDEYGCDDIGYRGGALNFKVQDGKLVEIDRPVADAKESRYINRCLYVGENIYMIYNEYYNPIEIYTAKYK